ncbi:hypothetical protein CNMCM6106_006287 [Aspergillus hiratsukae]|uniref:Uncharacterized protein n=1 Tax=Aspergillus hiratsukae TaxID=1194566 RepID=A0A8H6PS72_9EURO|nr:hypothetical protein CNMCM6106_006287 [Aspergillus hiratsukae]
MVLSAARSLHQDTLNFREYGTLLPLSGSIFSPAISLRVQFPWNAPETDRYAIVSPSFTLSEQALPQVFVLDGFSSACLPPSANPAMDPVGCTFNDVLRIRRKDQAPAPFSIPPAESGCCNDGPKLSTVASVLMGLLCRPFILKWKR